jgi:GGDEF domain-containing protein
MQSQEPREPQEAEPRPEPPGPQDAEELPAAGVDPIASASPDAISRLGSVEQELRAIAQAEGCSDPHGRFWECLDRLRDEIRRQHDEVAAPISDSKTTVANIEATSVSAWRTAPSQIDPATGLPERSAAEAAIENAIREKRTAFAAIFVLERLDVINTRFGYKVGDEIFSLYSRDLAHQLGKEDRLFRWTGPALLALLDRSEDIRRVRGDVVRIATKRFSRTIEADNRCVLLSVGATATVISLAESDSDGVIRELESFVNCSSEPPSRPA